MKLLKYFLILILICKGSWADNTLNPTPPVWDGYTNGIPVDVNIVSPLPLPIVVTGTVSPPVTSNAVITSITTINGSSVTLVSSNLTRTGLILHNDSAGTHCYVSFASSSSNTTYTFNLLQGSTYIMDPPIYQGPVSGYCGNGKIMVTELH